MINDIGSTPCQYGQLSREEYRAGVRREFCSRPSATTIVRDSASGGYLVYLCGEHAPQDETDTTLPALVQVGTVFVVEDEEGALMVVRACIYCEQSICREDAADAWRRYASMDADTYLCESSPNDAHAAICSDCAGRGGTIGQMCATCEGWGYFA